MNLTGTGYDETINRGLSSHRHVKSKDQYWTATTEATNARRL